MKRVIRKAGIMFLCAALISTLFAVTASADDTVRATGPDGDVLLEELGLRDSCKILARGTTFVDGAPAAHYTISFANDVENDVVVLRMDDGGIRMLAKEGEKENDVIFEADGTIWLNGKEVTIEYEETTSATSRNAGLKSAGSSVTFSSTPAYGSAGTYTYYYRDVNVSDVAFQTALQSLATSVFVAIIVSAAGGGNWTNTFVSTAADWLSLIAEVAPTSTHASYKAAVYTPASYHSGYIPSLFLYCEKFVAKCYAKKNYSSYACTKTFYRINYQG